MKSFEAVIFDIDGTLTEEVSWTSLTRDMGGSAEEHSAIFSAFRAGEFDYPTAKKKLLNLWRATGNDNRPFMEDAFANWPTRAEAPALVNWLKHEGYLVALITGSLDMYAEAMAQRLGVEHYYANTEMVFDSQDNLVDFHYELDQAKKKSEQFESFCKSRNINPATCIVVGDSDNDLELFRETGHGILLGDTKNTDLIRTAWKRIGSLAEVKSILE